MADDAQIGRLLHQFRGTGMLDLACESTITDLINDYFTKRPGENGTISAEGNISDEDEDEEGLDLVAKDTPVPHKVRPGPKFWAKPRPRPKPKPKNDDKGADGEPDSEDPPAASAQHNEDECKSDEEERASERQPIPAIPAIPALQTGGTASSKHPLADYLLPCCSCQLFEGQPCFLRFDPATLYRFRVTSMVMSRELLDAAVLSQIAAGLHQSAHTECKRKKNKERVASRTDYYHGGYRICGEIFRYLYATGKSRLNNLIKHYKANGHGPRTYKKSQKPPSNAISAETTSVVRDFILNFASVHAIHLPGHTPQHWKSNLKLLPKNSTKRSVFNDYVASCAAASIKSVSLSSFKRIWQDSAPFVAVVKPAADLCSQCHQNMATMTKAVQGDEDDKTAALVAYNEHLIKARQERTVYTNACESCKCMLSGFEKLGPHNACSGGCDTMHYSFSFSQHIHYPSNPVEPSAVYLKQPRRCAVFGVCCEPLSSQVNFLLDEGFESGDPGVKSANWTISLLHFFFENYGLGERQVHLHADNCCERSKSSAVLQYLMWRVLNGQHASITLSFMLTGHSVLSCDWCFGLFKRPLRKTKIECLQDVADVVSKSSRGNIAQLCGTEYGDSFVPLYDWSSYLARYFHEVKQLERYHHFTLSYSSGAIKLKEYSDSPTVEQNLLIRALPAPAGEFPAIIPPRGLDAARQWYLFDEIRPFLTEGRRDVVAPLPLVPRPDKAPPADTSNQMAEPGENQTPAEHSAPKKAKKSPSSKGKPTTATGLKPCFPGLLSPAFLSACSSAK